MTPDQDTCSQCSSYNITCDGVEYRQYCRISDIWKHAIDIGELKPINYILDYISIFGAIFVMFGLVFIIGVGFIAGTGGL
jgi:hypothetical protein